jgi:hypothetical protein
MDKEGEIKRDYIPVLSSSPPSKSPTDTATTPTKKEFFKMMNTEFPGMINDICTRGSVVTIGNTNDNTESEYTITRNSNGEYVYVPVPVKSSRPGWFNHLCTNIVAGMVVGVVVSALFSIPRPYPK